MRRYHLIDFREDKHIAYLKSDQGGAAIAKTGKLIIIGTWEKEKKQNGGDCNITVEKLADQFLKANY